MNFLSSSSFYFYVMVLFVFLSNIFTTHLKKIVHDGARRHPSSQSMIRHPVHFNQNDAQERTPDDDENTEVGVAVQKHSGAWFDVTGFIFKALAAARSWVHKHMGNHAWKIGVLGSAFLAVVGTKIYEFRYSPYQSTFLKYVLFRPLRESWEKKQKVIFWVTQGMTEAEDTKLKLFRQDYMNHLPLCPSLKHAGLLMTWKMVEHLSHHSTLGFYKLGYVRKFFSYIYNGIRIFFSSIYNGNAYRDACGCVRKCKNCIKRYLCCGAADQVEVAQPGEADPQDHAAPVIAEQVEQNEDHEIERIGRETRRGIWFWMGVGIVTCGFDLYKGMHWVKEVAMDVKNLMPKNRVVRYFYYVLGFFFRFVGGVLFPPMSLGLATVIEECEPTLFGSIGAVMLSSAIAGFLPAALCACAHYRESCDWIYYVAATFSNLCPLTSWVQPAMTFARQTYVQYATNPGQSNQAQAQLEFEGRLIEVFTGHMAPNAGAAATLLQMKYFPDVITNVVTQPVGLLEDYASMALARMRTNQDEGYMVFHGMLLVFNGVTAGHELCEICHHRAQGHQIMLNDENILEKAFGSVVGLISFFVHVYFCQKNWKAYNKQKEPNGMEKKKPGKNAGFWEKVWCTTQPYGEVYGPALMWFLVAPIVVGAFCDAFFFEFLARQCGGRGEQEAPAAAAAARELQLQPHA